LTEEEKETCKSLPEHKKQRNAEDKQTAQP
jgi:hypothetical protein